MNFVIIGGDAAGMSAASRAKRTMPDLEVTVLEKTMDVSYSACGMPYNIADPDREIEDLVVRHAHVFREKQDINLLPVLKKIASDKTLEEGIYKRSVEMVEILEKLIYSNQVEPRKIAKAKKNLLGTRQPQTTEILRLLRDNSIESKRLAIYMIGKFSLSDMLPEVCECLSIAGLESDAYAVLKSFGKAAEDELLRYYLVSSGNINTSKTILRLLGKICTKESNGFLFSRLWSNSRQLK